MNSFRWTRIAGSEDGAFPAIYRSDRTGELLVQGYWQDDFRAPAGEQAVRIPFDVLQQAVKVLSDEVTS